MDFVETEGDTIDQAIEKALQALGVEREKITVDVLVQGKRGILGFGAQKARIRAVVLKREPAVPAARPAPGEQAPADAAARIERARSALADIVRLMGVEAAVEARAASGGEEIVLEIKTDNSAILIGRKGQTLEALQYLVSRIAGERQTSGEPHLVVDIENYRERRRKSLEDMALRLGEKAKRQRKVVTIDALSAADRRVIHAALQDDPWLTTKSLGQGAYRRLLIIPERDRKTKKEAQEPRAEKAGGKSEL
ncbi:MAG TPA: RNA-binding cell elongation regulator Jag/EloR [Candidatus Eisenbacteria bacterium]|nr:RNA-binding cell elongation regulator Jag/EloR [Candidatus Eisenbacteria bacterium]